uniref:Retrovirus-related Pol polyprotein from transposon TNT 1-94-like beta-barrel domain-containing protein n=1 Tax=Ananas comosus var. bracteatus TaxID=296719 RepID=A0A6V7NGJ6_ANACO|nr:unnamed protein product [Ananas comosus var. bracteatus]
MEPKWTSDAELYYQYREETRLVQLLMALQDDFESVRASILYRTPLPTVDAALSELIAEETRKGTSNFHNSDDACVLATSVARNTRSSGTSRDMRYQNSAPRPTSSSSRDMSQVQCNYCKQYGHTVRFCTSPTSRHMQSKQRNNYEQRAATTSSVLPPQSHDQAHSSASSNVNSSSLTMDHIQEMIKQALGIGTQSSASAISGTQSSTSALSSTSGIYSTDWFFDSGASNHMTCHSQFLTKPTSMTSSQFIRTANGSIVTATHTGLAKSKDLHLPNTFLVPKLSMNLISIGQLCDLGLTVIFDSSDCIVQDRKTGKQVGTGRKVGRLFVVDNLHIPSWYLLCCFIYHFIFIFVLASKAWTHFFFSS